MIILQLHQLLQAYTKRDTQHQHYYSIQSPRYIVRTVFAEEHCSVFYLHCLLLPADTYKEFRDNIILLQTATVTNC